MLFCGGTHLQIMGMSFLSARARAPAKLCICIRFCLQILTPEMLANKTAVSPREPVVLHAPRCRLGWRDLSVRPSVRPAVATCVASVQLQIKRLSQWRKPAVCFLFPSHASGARLGRLSRWGRLESPAAPSPHHPFALFLPSHTPFSFAPDLYLPHFTTHRPQFS